MARKSNPKRRAPGTGSIRFKKGREKPYEAAFPLGRGEYRYDAFSLRSEAEEYLDRLVKERDSVEAPRNVAKGSQLVRSFLPTWLETKRGRVRPKTLAAHQYYCELAIGEIGGYRLDEVTRERADTLLTYFYGKGFQNVEQLRATLSQAFEYAHQEDYIRKNPFKLATAPMVERRKAIALTAEQRNILLRAAIGTPLCALWHLYSRVGLRRGEGLGLRWCDVDWSGGTITIAQQFTELNGRILKSQPKTKRSGRTIPLPPNLLDMLRRMYDERGASDLIFPDKKGGPRHPSSVLYTFKRLVKRAGLPPMHIHDLRHTAQYRLEQDGAPLSVRMALLGHTSTSQASHYGDHADFEAMRQVVRSIA